MVLSAMLSPFLQTGAYLSMTISMWIDYTCILLNHTEKVLNALQLLNTSSNLFLCDFLQYFP